MSVSALQINIFYSKPSLQILNFCLKLCQVHPSILARSYRSRSDYDSGSVFGVAVDTNLSNPLSTDDCSMCGLHDFQLAANHRQTVENGEFTQLQITFDLKQLCSAQKWECTFFRYLSNAALKFRFR